jgi:hypothetical protein
LVEAGDHWSLDVIDTQVVMNFASVRGAKKPNKIGKSHNEKQ